MGFSWARYSLTFCFFIGAFAPSASRAVLKTTSLDSIQKAQWEETINQFEPGDRLEIDGAQFSLLKEITFFENPLRRVFLAERLDVKRKAPTVLKVIRNPFVQSEKHHWLENEKLSLETQAKYMRAPEVYFLSDNHLVMEKEYIDGDLYQDWLEKISIKTFSESDLNRFFSTLKMIQEVERTGLIYDDASSSNAVFERETGELVIFDGGNIEQGRYGITFGLEHPKGYYESMLINLDRYLLWTISDYYFNSEGSMAVKKSRTLDAVEYFKKSDGNRLIFESIYQLNSFHKKYPDLHRHLKKAFSRHAEDLLSRTETLKMKAFHSVQMNGDLNFYSEASQWVKNELDQNTLTDQEKITLGALIYKSGLPGQKELEAHPIYKNEFFSRFLKSKALSVLKLIRGHCETILLGRPPLTPPPESI